MHEIGHSFDETATPAVGESETSAWLKQMYAVETLEPYRSEQNEGVRLADGAERKIDYRMSAR